MKNLKSQNLLKHIKITVAMQELVTRKQTEGGDPAVNCLADSESTLAQNSVILGRR